jgi:hypothetical protein
VSDDEDAPVGEHPLFVVVVWVTLALAFASFILLMVALNPHQHKPLPAPAPWSCASERAKVALVDAGGQIAPVCGETPYPN